MTKEECGRQIVVSVNDLAEHLMQLASRYNDPSEADYRAGIATAAGYARRCAAALALELQDWTEGEVVR